MCSRIVLFLMVKPTAGLTLRLPCGETSPTRLRRDQAM